MKDNKRKELMSGLVLDFSSDSDQLMKEHVIPALEELQEMFFANDKKALDLYREAGLDEIKVQWRNFDTVRLNFFQRRRIKKIADDQELLGDAQIHFIIFGNVIFKHRPDLMKKYGKFDLWTVGSR